MNITACVVKPPSLEYYLTSSGEWVLYKGISDGKWMRVRLIRIGRHPKVSYWLSWGVIQRRMARSKDWALLTQHNPETAKWVVSALEAMAPD